MLRFLILFVPLSAIVLWGQADLLMPVTQKEVWGVVASYLRAQGIGEEQIPNADDFEFPGVTLAGKDRGLRVAGLCWDNRMERVAFRIECAQAGACLPFLVYGAIKQEAYEQLNAAGKVAANCSRPPGTTASKARKEIIVRAGQHAMVTFRGNQMRLSEQVTSAEQGAAGDIVRVRNADGVQFRARVVGPGLLEALGNGE